MGLESDYSSSGHCGGVGSIPGPVQWVKVSGVTTVATWFATVAQIPPLAWECSYAMVQPRKLKKKIHQPHGYYYFGQSQFFVLFCFVLGLYLRHM